MRRRLIIAATLLIGVSAASWVVVRSTLNPDAVRRAAESKLSALLGQPVSIGNVRVSAFPVPAVVGSDIAIGVTPETPDLTLQRIRIVPRIRSLFRGPYVIRDVSLDGLTVRIVREPPGRWKFPAIVPAPGGDEGTGLIVERVRLTGGAIRVQELTAGGAIQHRSSVADIEGEAIADSDGLRISPIRGHVGTSVVSGEAVMNAREARLDFSMPEVKGQDLKQVLALAATDPPDFVTLPRAASVSLSIRIDRLKSRLSGSGSLRAPELSVDTLRLQRVEAPIHTDGVRITFDPTTFSMYGGAHTGTVVVDLSRSPASWSAESKVTGVNVGQFLTALSGRDQRLDGTASATSSLRARVGDPLPRGLEGRMRVEVMNGVVREFPLLNAINRALRLAEGSSRDTRFERLSATIFVVRTGGDSIGTAHMATNDLVLQARDVRVAAGGRIGFDRSLDLAGLAIMSPERAAEAIRSVRELSGLRNDRGELELPIRIGGTLDAPSFGIDVAAVVGRSLKEELRRRLRDLFRREGL